VGAKFSRIALGGADQLSERIALIDQDQLLGGGLMHGTRPAGEVGAALALVFGVPTALPSSSREG
jgi:hypothetical protein